MADPYQILGVSREATQDELRKAFRSLAKKNHPDLHPGDTAAETRFKAIASAYAIVGDEAKRAQFDRGEIDDLGAERHKPERESYRQYAEAGPSFKYDTAWQENGTGGNADLFAELFRRHSAGAKARGSDIGYTIAVDFIEAVTGAKKRIVMADGKTLDMTIPAGLTDGQTLRLRGQGHPGLGGGEPGDALLTVHVKPDPAFRRDGDNIRSTLRVTPGEAMAGAKVRVPTVTGSVMLAVPKGSNSGTILRLNGKGVPAAGRTGDHFIELQVILPDSPDEEFIRRVTEWEANHPYDPRQPKGAPS